MNDTDNFDYKKHGKDFLEYAAENRDKLIKSMRRNQTKTPGVCPDEVFSEVILKIYDSITVGKNRIDDFKKYIFIAGKFKYMEFSRHEKERTLRDEPIDYHLYVTAHDSIDETDEEIECRALREDRAHDRYQAISSFLAENFGKENADMYFDYYDHKVRGTLKSYTKISKEYQIPITRVRVIMGAMKKSVAENFNPSYKTEQHNADHTETKQDQDKAQESIFES